jgi:acetyltransferase-like isoleucine patch superfamily enzyme/acyl carrier protein
VNAWLAGCARVGEDPWMDAPPTLILRGGRIEIGARLHLRSRPVPSHLAVGPAGAIVIGDDVGIAHGAAIASFERVEIGSGTRVGPFFVVMDTNFHVVGDKSERHETSPVVIGRDVRIGSRVTVLRGARIGDGATIQAGTVVSGVVDAGEHLGWKSSGWKVAADPEVARVPLVVKNALRLASTPTSALGPAEIPEWDSLGALKLLLALEETFSISLAEDAVARARTIGDLETIVEEARRAAATHDA